MRSFEDGQTIRGYGADHPDEFGGVYVEGETLVALFIGRPEWHLAELRPHLRYPVRVRTGETDRTWAEVLAANARIRHRLLGAAGFAAVHSVGIIEVDGRFEIQVGVEPLDAGIEGAIEDAVKPDLVFIRGEGRYFPL